MHKRHFYGYTIVAACFFIQAVCVGSMVTYGVFFKPLQAEFGWSRTFLSGASSVVFLVMGALGILFGRLNDRLGPRQLILVSGLVLGSGYLLMSLLGAPWQLYLFYGVLVGIGMSSHDIVTLSTIARWFRQRRGLMTGIVKAGTGTGQLVLPLLASSLIVLHGWRNTYLFIGAGVFLIYIVASRLLRRSPQEMGLEVDGHAPVVEALNEGGSGILLGEAVRTRQFWLCCVAYFCVIFCLLTIIVHIVPHASDIGLSARSAAAVMSTIGGASIVGRIAMGATADRIGSRRAFLICFIVLLAALVWLQGASRPWMLFLFALVYGFGHGGFYTVLSPTIAELFGMRAHGVIFGIVYFCGTLGGAIGPVVAGRTFDVLQSYDSAFLLLIGLAALGLVLVLALRPAHGSR